MAHLITGYAGEEHIQSKDQGSFNAAFFGTGQYVMEIGKELEATITSNNNVRISDGDLLMNGRHIRIETDMYEDVLIETGTAGTNRNDIIVMRYEKDASTGIEVAELEVVKGTESEGTAVDPAINTNDILEGASVSQMPLYRVKIQGVVLQAIEPMFDKIPTYATLAERYKQEFVESCQTHLDSLNILDSIDAVDANTEANQLAGANAVKDLRQELAEAGTIRYNAGKDKVEILGSDGLWYEWKFGNLLNYYLYYNGNQYLETTEGWEVASSNDGPGGVFYTNKDDMYLYYDFIDGCKQVKLAPKNKAIDLSGYQSIEIDYYCQNALAGYSASANKIRLMSPAGAELVKISYPVGDSSGVLTLPIPTGVTEGYPEIQLNSQDSNAYWRANRIELKK